MALIRCDYFSDVLEMGTSMTVILPQRTAAQIGVEQSADAEPDPDEAPATLYLLHGLSDDASAWLRYTSIERYATERRIAVVMPQVARSFYCDMAHGPRWWDHLSNELPDVVHEFFRLSRRRADTYVAGLSMGGYGALKWALQQPERFAAAASLSGALDLAGWQDRGEEYDDIADAVFAGRRVAGSSDDLIALVDGLDQPQVSTTPSLYVSCGTEDHLLPMSRTFVAAAERKGLDVTVDLRPGEHEWGLWDTTIQDILGWLPPGR